MKCVLSPDKPPMNRMNITIVNVLPKEGGVQAYLRKQKKVSNKQFKLMSKRARKEEQENPI